MKKRWSRFLSILLALATVLSLMPFSFAAEVEEEPTVPTEITAEEDAEVPAEPDAEVAEEPAVEPEAETPAEEVTEEPAEEPEAPAEEPAEEAEEAEEAVEETVTEEPSAPVEEETPAEEPAEEAPAVVEEEEVYNTFAPSRKATKEMTLKGTQDYAKAFELLKLINAERASNGQSVLTMDTKVLDCAMIRAVESSVVYGSTRPSGDAWTTVLGDAGVTASKQTEIRVTAKTTADKALASLMSRSGAAAYLTSDEFVAAGIGCFYQDTDQTYYWTVILFRGPYAQATQPKNVTGTVTVDYALSALGAITVDLPAEMNVGTSKKASLSIDNGYKSCYPDASDVTFTSSNTAVLTVAEDGTVKAVKAGTATITAKLKSNSNVKATASVTVKLALPAPATVTVTNAVNGVKLTWSEVPGATGYEVYRSTKYGTWSGSTVVGSPSTTTFTDTNVTSGAIYYYTIRPYNVTGTKTTKGSYNETGYSILFLSAPKLTAAKPGDDGITVTWAKVTGATGYNVYRKSGTDGWKQIGTTGTGDTTTFVDHSGTKGTKYTYTVRATMSTAISHFDSTGVSATATVTLTKVAGIARNDVILRTSPSTTSAAGPTLTAGSTVNVISGWSKSVNGTTWLMVESGGKTFYAIATYILVTPTLGTVSNTDKGLKVTWTAQSNCEGYYVYRKTAETTWVKVGTVKGAASNSYVDAAANLTSGTAYIYTVRSYYKTILSRYDSTGITNTFLKTPTLVDFTYTTKSITVNWQKVSGATGYIVYRKTPSTGWAKLATVTSGSTVTYTDKTAVSGTAYIYTVRATKGSAQSDFFSYGMMAMIIPSGKLTTYGLLSDTNYRYEASAKGALAGTLKAGASVQIVTNWNTTADKFTWYRALINGQLYYISVDNMIAAPKMGAITVKASSVTITWNTVDKAEGYALYRKAYEGNWYRIANLDAKTTTYTDTSVSSGTTYTYTARAIKGSVQSPFEPGLRVKFLSTPSLTSATASNAGIKVSWGMVTGAQGYLVYRKDSAGNWKEIAKVTGASTISYTDNKDLTKGTKYTYTVRAYFNSYTSSYLNSGITATATITSNPTTKDYVTTSTVNYRESAGTSGKLAGTLQAGVTVKVVVGGDVKVDNTVWYQIYLNNNFYYLSSNYVKAK